MTDHANPDASPPVPTDPAADVDELLAALDEFANAVHWLRQRTDYRAATALTEALTEWTDTHTTDHSNIDAGATPAAAVTAVAGAVSGADWFTVALTEALSGWTAAVSAEHHRSEPFQQS